MIFKRFISVIFYSCCAIAAPSWAAIVVVDDSGETVTLEQAAQRVISLSPHLAELVYEVGAGDSLVATVEYSNYPIAAQTVEVIGSSSKLDLEKILSLKPDLILAWQSGNNVADIAFLQKIGLPVYFSEPRRLEDIADNIGDIATLLGKGVVGHSLQTDIEQRIEQLPLLRENASELRVFYEIWHQPLFTLGGAQIVSDALARCGYNNIFAETDLLAFSVSVEEVVVQHPERIIFAFSESSSLQQAKTFWLEREALINIDFQHNPIIELDGEKMNRPTLRMLDEVERLCALPS